MRQYYNIQPNYNINQPYYNNQPPINNFQNNARQNNIFTNVTNSNGQVELPFSYRGGIFSIQPSEAANQPDLHIQLYGNNHNHHNQQPIPNLGNSINQLIEEVEITGKAFDKFENKNCVICLENYSIGEKICYLPCFHFFHSLCIKNWITKSKKCPMCNIEIKLNNMSSILGNSKFY